MSEGLAQGPYVMARVKFEPATLRTQGTEPTSEPPHPLIYDTEDPYIFESVELSDLLQLMRMRAGLLRDRCRLTLRLHNPI